MIFAIHRVIKTFGVNVMREQLKEMWTKINPGVYTYLKQQIFFKIYKCDTWLL